MITAIAFNRPEPGRPDSEDVLREVEFVESALRELGHETVRIPADAGLDGLAGIIRLLGDCKANAVFNLIESLGDVPRLHPAGAALLDITGLPFTGSRYEALLMTTDKAASKAILKAAGIPTPAWAVYPDSDAASIWEGVAAQEACIAKPLLEDASVGITDNSVFTSQDALARGLSRMNEEHGRLLVERFAGGREFNVSIIEGPDGQPSALPVAEMCFRDWPDGKPRIVNYRAKWDSASFEYNNTIRAFPDDPEIIESIKAVALASWRVFKLRGYARVDIRLDDTGSPQVIEVNANPCISPDSGFVATARRAGLSPAALVGGILDAAMARGERQ